MGLKDTPNWPQSDPKWLLFGVWEPPWNHGASRAPNSALIWSLRVPQRDPFGTPWRPWGPTNPPNSTKNTLKVSIQKHNTKKSRTMTLPNLKKYGFTAVKHTFLEIPLTPKKSLKWPPNDPQTTPKAPHGRQKAPPGPLKTEQKAHQEKRRLKDLKKNLS